MSQDTNSYSDAARRGDPLAIPQALVATPSVNPTLRIRGFAMMGGVGVEVRLPGDTAREAKKQRRLERKGLLPRLAPPKED